MLKKRYAKNAAVSTTRFQRAGKQSNTNIFALDAHLDVESVLASVDADSPEEVLSALQSLADCGDTKISTEALEYAVGNLDAENIGKAVFMLLKGGADAHGRARTFADFRTRKSPLATLLLRKFGKDEKKIVPALRALLAGGADVNEAVHTENGKRKILDIAAENCPMCTPVLVEWGAVGGELREKCGRRMSEVEKLLAEPESMSASEKAFTARRIYAIDIDDVVSGKVSVDDYIAKYIDDEDETNMYRVAMRDFVLGEGLGLECLREIEGEYKERTAQSKKETEMVQAG